MAEPDISWEGASGKTYNYWVHPIGADFKDEPGNYIYAKETKPQHWRPVYIGQTSSLADRLADHEKEALRYAKRSYPHPCAHDFRWAAKASCGGRRSDREVEAGLQRLK